MPLFPIMSICFILPGLFKQVPLSSFNQLPHIISDLGLQTKSRIGLELETLPPGDITDMLQMKLGHSYWGSSEAFG